MRCRTHSHGDQSTHDIVDTRVDRFIGVHAIVEEEALAVRRLSTLLRQQLAQRDFGVRLNLVESSQTWQRSCRFSRQFESAAQRTGGKVTDSLGDSCTYFSDRGDGVDDPIADRHTGLVFEVGAVDHVRDTVREGSTRLGPLYEFTGGRPGVIGRGGTDNQTEMACTQVDS